MTSHDHQCCFQVCKHPISSRSLFFFSFILLGNWFFIWAKLGPLVEKTKKKRKARMDRLGPNVFFVFLSVGFKKLFSWSVAQIHYPIFFFEKKVFSGQLLNPKKSVFWNTKDKTKNTKKKSKFNKGSTAAVTAEAEGRRPQIFSPLWQVIKTTCICDYYSAANGWVGVALCVYK